MTALNGSTVHLLRSTPTTSMCATSNNAREGSAIAVLRTRAMTALRPGVNSKISGEIPSFSKIAATYFAAASSFPGGFVVLIRTKSASQPTASFASDGASWGFGVFAGMGKPGATAEGTCAISGKDAAKINATLHATTSNIRFQFKKPPCVSAFLCRCKFIFAAANVLLRMRFILTCMCRHSGASAATRCVNFTAPGLAPGHRTLLMAV
jgi:hypothetical protein